MVAVTVVVSSQWSVVGGSEARWVVPLALASSRSDLVARVYGVTVGTVNIVGVSPFIIALRERVSTAIQGKRPRSGHESD
jgi:hypothetical protein